MTNRQITRADVVAAARTWLGTPYHHQARLKGVGVDCAGLPLCVARDDLALVEPSFDVGGYDRVPDGRTLVAQADRYMIRRAPEVPLLPGMVVVTVVDKEPQHFGILGDYWHGSGLLTIIHATNRGRPPSVIEHRLMFHSSLRLFAAYDIPGVASCN